MIKEYAVDPNVLTTWQNARYILEKFGFDKGRLISRFPREWEGMVKESCKDLLPREKARIIEILVSSRKNLISFGRIYDRTIQNWFRNVLLSNKQRPFHAIISNQTEKHTKTIILPDDVNESHQLVNCTRSITLRRTPRKIALTISPILAVARKIVFVDPYINKMKDQHMRPLVEIFKVIFDREEQLPLEKMEIHCQELNDKAISELTSWLADCLGKLIPKKKTLNVFLWHPKELHDRFLLTEMGGVMIGAGFDDDGKGKHTTDTTVALLDSGSYPEHWHKYVECGKKPQISLNGVEE